MLNELLEIEKKRMLKWKGQKGYSASQCIEKDGLVFMISIIEINIFNTIIVGEFNTYSRNQASVHIRHILNMCFVICLNT